VILPYFPHNPKAKLRLEVLFKKFHLRIILATLFSTKSYLLNKIKPFSGHENCSLTKSQKIYKGVQLGTWTLKFWVRSASSWPKRLREPKFQLYRSYEHKFLSTAATARDRRQLFYSFFHVLWLFIGKKHDLSKKNISKFLECNHYFQYRIANMMKVKIFYECV
jgi:hypothetical protein